MNWNDTAKYWWTPLAEFMHCTTYVVWDTLPAWVHNSVTFFIGAFICGNSLNAQIGCTLPLCSLISQPPASNTCWFEAKTSGIPITNMSQMKENVLLVMLPINHFHGGYLPLMICTHVDSAGCVSFSRFYGNTVIFVKYIEQLYFLWITLLVASLCSVQPNHQSFHTWIVIYINIWFAIERLNKYILYAKGRQATQSVKYNDTNLSRYVPGWGCYQCSETSSPLCECISAH